MRAPDAGECTATGAEALASAGPVSGPGEGAREEEALRLRRLELDNDDLRAENARLKASILRHQEETVAMGERLGQLKAQLETVHRVAAWSRLRRYNPLRGLLRRLG